MAFNIRQFLQHVQPVGFVHVRPYGLRRKVSAQFCSTFSFSIVGRERYTGCMSEVTRLLDAAAAGDRQAAGDLLPLVYDELRQLAAQRLVQERSGQSWQATALVHEAYLRLVDVDKVQHWNGRGHFFAAAAEAMRRILVENARRKKRLKYGGDRTQLELNADLIADSGPSEDLLALDEALTSLAAREPQVAKLVELRYFGGMTVKEAAKVLGVSPRTADIYWSYAKSWLLAELRGDEP